MIALLETKNLSFHAGEKLLCDNLSLEIQSGEIWGILGPNGCGKTTLLQTLAGLLKPSAGEVLLQGQNIFSLSRKNIAKKIGILFQDTQDIFPQTVWEVCRSGRYPHDRSRNDESITKQALIDMDLTNIAAQSIQTLSGGERKRLSIATLLTQTPNLYLLDEPTNYLDLHYQIKVLNHFKYIANNYSASIIMSLHDINLASHYCQKILLLLDNGKHISGSSSIILTKENLSRLYQHPLNQMIARDATWWQPCFYA